MRLFAFLSSVALASAYIQCPDQKPVVNQPCNNPTLFAFDVSDTISSNDAKLISNFIFQNLTPSLANGQTAGVILGGVSGTNPIVSFKIVAAIRVPMLLQTVQEALADFNIQADINGASGNETTRIAVVTYASTDYSAGYSNNIVEYKLGELSLAAFQNLQTIQRYYDSYRTHSIYPPYPDRALYTASTILTSSPRFGKVLPVVIHLTGTDEDRTNSVIGDIINKGGVIFTYQLFGAGDLPTDGYFDQRIAGSNYIPASALYAKQRTVDPQFIRRGLCLAVCKCPLGYQANKVDSTYGTPVGGCLVLQTLANYPTAQSRCAKVNDGIVAPTKTAAESKRYCSMANNGNFYTGMMWDSQQQKYIWSDGTPVDGDYQPWYNNMTHPTGQDCVMVYCTHYQEWVPTYCKNGFPYVCKTHPCDSATRC